MKVALIGSRGYENVRKVKDTLFQLKQKFGDKTSPSAKRKPKKALITTKEESLNFIKEKKAFNLVDKTII